MAELNARRKRRAVLWIGLILLAFAAAACASKAPQDTLKPVGPVAREENNLFTPVFWIAAGVFVLVEGGILFIVAKFRRRSDADQPKQIHGNKRLEIIWTILPAALLAGIAIPVVLTIFDVAQKPVGSEVVHINLTAHQWWWQYEYTDFKTPQGVTIKTANELVIPTGRWVYLTMTSADVIHSYWVPKLSGKQDVIPGRITHLKLRSDVPGVFNGQCAEFCALSHANMRLKVIAQAPADFDAWVQNELQPARAPTDPIAFGIITTTCAQCHTIRGILGPGGVERVGGTLAPDLTHFATRTSFAGSMLEMTPANIALWLKDPPGIKPGVPIDLSGKEKYGTMMPNYHLSADQIQALVAYLTSLK